MITEKNKKVIKDTEDWAVLPFDEEEDQARWTRLIEETDELIEEAAQLESVHGKLLSENKLSEIQFTNEELEDEVF